MGPVSRQATPAASRAAHAAPALNVAKAAVRPTGASAVSAAGTVRKDRTASVLMVKKGVV